VKKPLARLMQALPDIALIEKTASELRDLGDVVTVDEDFGKIGRNMQKSFAPPATQKNA
jgi:hypothetical protein